MHIPASNIQSLLDIVPVLIRRPPITLLRSDISSGAFDIIGDAPRARVAFADCVETTVFVIYETFSILRSRISAYTLPDGPMD